MLVNRTRLDVLMEEIGEEDFDDVLDMFLSESAATMDRLLTGDSAESRKAALHGLKGTALTMGLDDLAGLCRRGETGESIDPALLQAVFGQSCEALAALRDQIRNSARISSFVMSR